MAAKKKTSAGKSKGSKTQPSSDGAKPSAGDIAYSRDVVELVLKELGYSELSREHGISELDGALLFADFDRFGCKHYCAALTKSESISGKSKNTINEIVDNVTRVLSAKFKSPLSDNDTSISHLYVITSEDFTDGAVSKITNDSKILEFAGKVSFIDGKHVEKLHAASFQEMNELLFGARNELRKNSNIAQYNMDSWGGTKASLFRYQMRNTQKLVDFLVKKDLHEEARKKLEKYLFLIDSFNLAANVVLFSNTPGSTVHYMKRLEEGASAAYKQSEELLAEIDGLITTWNDGGRPEGGG